jgi:hypothetical protein
LEGKTYPATAQVASQKAEWLAKRLNKGDIDMQTFHWKNMGIMAYVGNWNAILQTDGGDISGRAAWFIWRGAYLTKSVSWRNKILIPTYCELLSPSPYSGSADRSLRRVFKLVVWQRHLSILGWVRAQLNHFSTLIK